MRIKDLCKKTSNESAIVTELDCTVSGIVFGRASSRMPCPLRQSTTPLFGPVDAGKKGMGPDVVHAPRARPQSLQRVVLEQLCRKGDGKIFSNFEKMKKKN